jgi:hypothetical protein
MIWACGFHLLRDLGRPLFEQVQRHLAANGLKIARGTIVDAGLVKAGIINAPSSTKNADKNQRILDFTDHPNKAYSCPQPWVRITAAGRSRRASRATSSSVEFRGSAAASTAPCASIVASSPPARRSGRNPGEWHPRMPERGGEGSWRTGAPVAMRVCRLAALDDRRAARGGR